MTKMYKILMLVLPLTYCASTYAWVNSGGYVGAELGVANQITSFNSGTFGVNSGGANLDASRSGFLARANLGYQFNSYSALELGNQYAWGGNYQYPGNSQNGSAQIGSNTVDFSYLLSLPITQSNFSVFARFGLAYQWVNSTGYNASGMDGGAFTDVIGSGIKYRIGKYMSIRAEWIADGLWQPVGLSANNQQAGNLSSQNFLIGINYYY
jgi:hypothetical protein